MKELKMTGGARIGHVKATWPLVSMIVTPDSLVIEASLLGRVEFTPEDVIAIKPYEPIRGLGRGIQIVHNVSVYKEKIIFWGSASVAQLLEEISRTGFEANGSESTRLLLSEELTRRKNLTGSPFKKPLWVAAIVLFYAVFFADIFRLIPSSSPAPFGSGTMGLMFLFSAGSLLTAFSDSFAAYVLKKERKRTDVKTALLFIAVITGFISMIATLMVFA